jgi:hypothetical protein
MKQAVNGFALRNKIGFRHQFFNSGRRPGTQGVIKQIAGKEDADNVIAVIPINRNPFVAVVHNFPDNLGRLHIQREAEHVHAGNHNIRHRLVARFKNGFDEFFLRLVHNAFFAPRVNQMLELVFHQYIHVPDLALIQPL